MVKTYGTTDVENKSADSIVCRQIVKEIMSFGVSQQQLLFVIELLAFELENRDHLQRITSLMKNIRDDAPKTTLVV